MPQKQAKPKQSCFVFIWERELGLNRVLDSLKVQRISELLYFNMKMILLKDHLTYFTAGSSAQEVTCPVANYFHIAAKRTTSICASRPGINSSLTQKILFKKNYNGYKKLTRFHRKCCRKIHVFFPWHMNIHRREKETR